MVMRDTNRGYFPNFDWLRFLFAVQVVAVHTGGMKTVFINAVPAFLAISGFVVLGSLERRSIGSFFVSRALRVMPLLILSFVAVWVIFDVHVMITHILFWLWPFGGVPPANPVVWSLIYEEFFYVMLASLFVLRAYRYRVTPVILMLACIAVLETGRLPLVLAPLFTLGGAFFLGNAMYLYRAQIQRVNPWLATALCVGMACYILTIKYSGAVRIGFAMTDFLSVAVTMVFAIAGPKLPRLKVDLSYSLYLTHCLVMSEIVYFIPVSIRLFWIVLLSTLPICYLSWHMVESPILRLRDKLSSVGRLNRTILSTAIHSTPD